MGILIYLKISKYKVQYQPGHVALELVMQKNEEIEKKMKNIELNRGCLLINTIDLLLLKYSIETDSRQEQTISFFVDSLYNQY